MGLLNGRADEQPCPSCRCIAQWRHPITGKQLLCRVFTTAEASWDAWLANRSPEGALGEDCRLLAAALAAWRQLLADAQQQREHDRAAAAADALRSATLLSKAIQGFRGAEEERTRRRGTVARMQIVLQRWRRWVQVARLAPSSRLSTMKRLRAAVPGGLACMQQVQHRLALRRCIRAWHRAIVQPQLLWRKWRLRLAMAAWKQQQAATAELLRAHARRWHLPRICGPILLLWSAVVKYLRAERRRRVASTTWHATYVAQAVLLRWHQQTKADRQLRLALAAADRHRACQLLRRSLLQWRLLVCRTSVVLGFRARRLQLAALWAWREAASRRRAAQQVEQPQSESSSCSEEAAAKDLAAPPASTRQEAAVVRRSRADDHPSAAPERPCSSTPGAGALPKAAKPRANRRPAALVATAAPRRSKT